jgi:hypothetical protein
MADHPEPVNLNRNPSHEDCRSHADLVGRGFRAERLHSHRPRQQGHVHDPAAGDGQGIYTALSMRQGAVHAYGPIAHYWMTSLQHPEWTPAFGQEPTQAMKSRKAGPGRDRQGHGDGLSYIPFPGSGMSSDTKWVTAG